MVCACGFHNNDSVRFCVRCGRELSASNVNTSWNTTGNSYESVYGQNIPGFNSRQVETPVYNAAAPKKKSKAGIIVLLLFLFLFVFVGGIVLTGLGIWGVPKLIVASHISNAEKYILSGDYGAAIDEYEAALKTSSKNEDAVLGLADACILKAGVVYDNDEACSYLNEALNAIEKSGLDKDDVTISSKISALEDILDERTLVEVWLCSDEVCYNADGNITYEILRSYDDKGNVVYVQYYYPSTDVSYYYHYEYDSDNRMTQNTVTSSQENYEYHYTYHYDSQGFSLGYTYENSTNNIICQDVIENDLNGNMIKETWYDNFGVVSWWTEYEYDNYGQVTSLKSFAPVYGDDGNTDGNYYLENWERYTYDGNGNKILVEILNENGDVYYHTEYVFSGNVMQGYTDYNEYGSIDSYAEYVTDSEGNILNCAIFDSTGAMTGSEEYTYDSRGNLTDEIKTSYYGNGNSYVSSFLYQYDSYGNKTHQKYKYDEYQSDVYYTYVLATIPKKYADLINK